MIRRATIFLAWSGCLAVLAPVPAAALDGNIAGLDVNLSGLAEFRLVAPSRQTSHTDGGFGKTRWGQERGFPIIPDFGPLVLRGSAGITPELRFVSNLRVDPAQKTAVDIIDAYIRYRPISTSRWRWTVKAGAFFPPISLENTGIGWTPEWTLSPSAIDSWIGQELRILGGEVALEWRGDVDRIEIAAAAFGWNEPAGAAIDGYGWSFSPHPVGLLGHVRLPNIDDPLGPRVYSYQFRQFDHSIGWYTGLAWDRADIGRIALLRYDNQGDPNAHDATEFGWRTMFWSLGFSTEIGPVTVLAQGMLGSTTISTAIDATSRTDFWSYYVLAGIERGPWRFAVRFDQFATRETTGTGGIAGDERGIAGTAAVTWKLRPGMSLTGEVLVVDSTRAQRVILGKSPHATELQAQVALRVWF